MGTRRRGADNPTPATGALRAQEREHGEHAAVVVGVAGRRSFVKMLVTCFSTARGVTNELLRDRLVRAALGHQLQHLALARGEGVERVVAAPPADELA